MLFMKETEKGEIWQICCSQKKKREKKDTLNVHCLSFCVIFLSFLLMPFIFCRDLTFPYSADTLLTASVIYLGKKINLKEIKSLLKILKYIIFENCD